MIGLKSFYKNWSHLNGPSIGIIIFENCRISILVTVDNDVSCHVTLGDFQRWPQGEKCSLTYQFLISSEKTTITQFARLCRIMTCLFNKIVRLRSTASYWIKNSTTDTFLEEVSESSQKNVFYRAPF